MSLLKCLIFFDFFLVKTGMEIWHWCFFFSFFCFACLVLYSLASVLFLFFFFFSPYLCIVLCIGLFSVFSPFWGVGVGVSGGEGGEELMFPFLPCFTTTTCESRVQVQWRRNNKLQGLTERPGPRLTTCPFSSICLEFTAFSLPLAPQLLLSSSPTLDASTGELLIPPLTRLVPPSTTPWELSTASPATLITSCALSPSGASFSASSVRISSKSLLSYTTGGGESGFMSRKGSST